MNRAVDIVPFNEITDIDATGFTYWGRRVSFKDCEAAILLIEGSQWKDYVGWRDHSSKPPHFQFPGTRHVIVTFPQNTFWNRLKGDKFIEFQSKMKNELGWETIDLS